MFIEHYENIYQSFVIPARMKEEKAFLEHHYRDAKESLFNSYLTLSEKPYLKDEYLLAGKITEEKRPYRLPYSTPEDEPDVEVILCLPVFKKNDLTFKSAKDDYSFEQNV
jgi:hypothetical protein